MEDATDRKTHPTGKLRWRPWLWGVVLLAVAIPAARVAWSYRPLNATERRLIGVWKFRVSPPMETPTEMFVTLTPDRRFMLTGSEEESGVRDDPGYGAWSSNGSELGIQEDREPWSWGAVRRIAREVMAGRHPFGGMTAVPIEFLDDDHLRFGPMPAMNGLTADMSRIGPPPANETTDARTRP